MRIYRPGGLLLRCRFFLSWWCSSCQGWGCSPIKRDRELGLQRRETVVLLFGGSVLISEGKGPLVREERGLVATSLPVVRQGIAGQPRYKK